MAATVALYELDASQPIAADHGCDRMIERIEQLRSEAEAGDRRRDDDATRSSRLRVRFLGRKAELPNLLRGVAQLPPEQRGAVGKAANQARQALEALIEARGARARRGRARRAARAPTAST